MQTSDAFSHMSNSVYKVVAVVNFHSWCNTHKSRSVPQALWIETKVAYNICPNLVKLADLMAWDVTFAASEKRGKIQKMWFLRCSIVMGFDVVALEHLHWFSSLGNMY